MQSTIIRVADAMRHPDELQEFMHRRRPLRMEQREHEVNEYLRNEGRRIFEQYGVQPVGGGSVAAAYAVCTATVFAMTTGAKTALNAIAPAGHGLAMTEFGVSFDGVTSSAVPAFCEVCNSTQAGAGTSGVTPTITQVRGRTTAGSAPTGGSNYTVEPTVLVRLKPLYIPQFNGTYVYQFPLGREVECDASGGTIKSLPLRINVTANVNFTGWVEVEALG